MEDKHGCIYLRLQFDERFCPFLSVKRFTERFRAMYYGAMPVSKGSRTKSTLATNRKVAKLRRALLRVGVAAVCLSFSQVANAMSALEFLRAEADNNEARPMKEVVIKLVAKGYKKVPDWARLSDITKKKILEKGYTNQDVEGIAEEAAVAAGMTR
jgi:hypothetical protein